jgi:hypothetical protein
MEESFTWLVTIASAYLSHRLLRLIYEAKPRWQSERERTKTDD